VRILGGYLIAVAEGDNLVHKTTLTDTTILLYVSAAAAYLEYAYGIDAGLHSTVHGTTTQKLHPYIAEMLAGRRAWAKPTKGKKEPVTSEMLEVLHTQAEGSPTADCLLPALAEWIFLAFFTGSRLGEYGESKHKSGSKWSTIPAEDGVPPEWRGQPIAFVAEDFEFFDGNQTRIAHKMAVVWPKSIMRIRIRFRYDKSKFNFQYRTFGKSPHLFLCPVKAGLAIIRRAHRLALPAMVPLGQYRAKNHHIKIITGEHVSDLLRDLCIAAYPDPEHYMRLNIHNLMSHSMRVTACVVLSNANVSLADICHRLRWNSDAVNLYIRDNLRFINETTYLAVLGVYHGTDPPSVDRLTR
jgi:hypothetical protein